MSKAVEVTGLNEALTALRKINARIVNRALGNALRAGLNEYMPLVQKRIPRREGVYAAALEIRKPMRRRGTMIAPIGLNKDKLYSLAGGRRPSNLPALLEFGHALKYRGKGGQIVDGGTVPASPHFRPAMLEGTPDAIEAITDSLRAAVWDAYRSAADRVAWNRKRAVNAKYIDKDKSKAAKWKRAQLKAKREWAKLRRQAIYLENRRGKR
jgi:hypothetical protein